ncbi:MAG: 6-carboxytetrahydropterin synthase QueD [Deltaproteobacteria bacterium]|nr:6-carboxytetrahydropterin synthase QueD [Deltaproteobacteria bacterium]
MATTFIEKELRFESAHRLPNVPEGHKCARIHGHSFRVTVRVAGPVHPHLGWVVDFADITEAWAPLHDLLDHRYLNEVEGLDNPTSENLARFIAERLVVPDASRLVSVTVHETCTSRCIYEL